MQNLNVHAILFIRIVIILLNTVMGIPILNRHRGISITLHVRARMYHYRDVPYIPYLPTTVATTLFSIFRSDLDFSS